MSQLFKLDFNLEVIEILCNGLKTRPWPERSMGWRGIHNLLYQTIGWGRDKDPIFVNTSMDPILFSSETWCECTTYFRDIVFEGQA